MNLETIIPSDESVRLLSAVLEGLDYRKLAATYSRLGRIEYSPRLLFKVVLYACCRGIYSSREIERACRENVNFMYLLEGQKTPDHNTIARFRSQHLPEVMEEKISTEEGILLRVNRSIQAEGVFAMIKADMNFRRFMMRGKKNVSVEWHLASMAYNILKLHHKAQTGRLGTHLVTPKTA